MQWQLLSQRFLSVQFIETAGGTLWKMLGSSWGAFLDSKEDGKQELADDFKDCIDNSFMPEEFEQKWQAFLDKYGINGDERFQHLYDLDIVGSRRISCIVSSPSSKQHHGVKDSMLS